MTTKIFSPEFLTLADLHLAYRKAKSDAFYDGLHPSAIAYSEFEQKLDANLKELYKRLTDENDCWWKENAFIGNYLVIPKSIDDSEWNKAENIHFRSVDPDLDWMQRFEENRKKRLDAKFRLIITPTVSYQIVSALWILKVGSIFEEKLDKNLSYGNRLRRKRHELEDFGSFNGPINNDAIGMFVPYFSAYRSWREKGLQAMKEMVESGKQATAITMDLASFYHQVNPSFILRKSFLKKINVKLTPDEKTFTRLILNSIEHWYQETPDYVERPEGALPVGLSTSKIISNILLFELDESVNNSLNPAYYGRYVDDIFLVFETPQNVASGSSVIEYLSKNVECLKIDRHKGSMPGLTVSFPYAHDSELKFTPSKQKIFSLSSEHGLDLINQISCQIRAQSSEYRMLPEVPESSVKMAEKSLLASSDASLIADVLRKADVVSVRRLGLSLLIRDIEAYSRDLKRHEWRDLRREFYGLAQRHLLTPKSLFELSGYYPRIFKLMVANHDFKEARDFIESLKRCFELLNKTIQIEKNKSKRLELCKAYFEKVLLQSAMQASTTRRFEEWPKLRNLLKNIFSLSGRFKIDLRKRSLERVSNELLFADLGSRSYKDFWYYSQSNDISRVKVPRQISVRKILRLANIRDFRKVARLRVPHWPALVFPTRPLTIQEIVLICPQVLDDPKLFKRFLWGLRGAKTFWDEGVKRKLNSIDCQIQVPNLPCDKVIVALTNFETTENQFDKSIQGNPDRSLARFKKLQSLANNILCAKLKPHYVVFPECSIPRRWAISIAEKLARQGVSLIAGLECYPHKKTKNIIRNDCLVSLSTRWPGYQSSFIYMQPKLKPSHGEAKKLKENKKSQFKVNDLKEHLPIYNHGGFRFGVLICSDMTNPKNRVHFQGKVDSLFVLEFNPDVKTFSFLVEGAAHDVHTFVIQVNNRLYGDSRVRAPYKEEHKRDSVRIKGGIEDYYVIAEIDYQSLRDFQRGKQKKSAVKFKPVPIGFEMSKGRSQ